jgi:hypothetical protein
MPSATFDVSNLVGYQEGMNEIVSGILMKNQKRTGIIKCAATMQTHISLR